MLHLERSRLGQIIKKSPFFSSLLNSYHIGSLDRAILALGPGAVELVINRRMITCVSVLRCFFVCSLLRLMMNKAVVLADCEASKTDVGAIVHSATKTASLVVVVKMFTQGTVVFIFPTLAFIANKASIIVGSSKMLHQVGPSKLATVRWDAS